MPVTRQAQISPLTAELGPGDIALMGRLGHHFADPALLVLALTHTTWANEHGQPEQNYERLEFLGDAVLQLLISESLWHLADGAAEGVLSRKRAQLVREGSLVQLAHALQVKGQIRLGLGQRTSGVPDSVLADVVEALMGAIYLEGGLPAVHVMLGPWLQGAMAHLSQSRDAKTELQEMCHRLGLHSPRYQVVSALGPDHARVYTIDVWVGERLCGRGEGSSKKVGEQRGAAEAIALLMQP